jgi:hypothetical protein
LSFENYFPTWQVFARGGKRCDQGYYKIQDCRWLVRADAILNRQIDKIIF